MKRHGFLPLALALVISGLPFVSSTPAIAAYAFTSHTFTPCGASGISGPTQSQCKSTYSTTWDESDSNFTVSSGIQLWTVPATAKYRFRIAGGSSPIQGRGRVIEMEINLTEGQQLKILVGQKSSCYLAEGCGGAGGTFVVDTNANIIGVAGGGGGYGVDATGSTTSTGGAGYGTVNSYAGAPASGGNGGGKGSNGDGNSGAGYSGDGSTNSSGAAGPLAFIRGGTASEGYDEPRSGRLSASIGNGGFGGGGGAWLNADGGNYTRSGGGGGYSGGGAGGYGGGKAASGGGGGASFISASATALNWSYGFNPINSDGYVIVTSLRPSLITFTPRTTLTNSSNITYDITFSEAVTGLASNDFSVSGTGSSTCTIGSPSGSGTTYAVTLSGCSPGTVIMTMSSGAVSNSSSQTAPSTNTAAATVVIDQTAPTISSVLAPSNSTYIPGNALNFTVNFSESVTVTGSPRLTLTVGALTKYATFVSLTDSKTATFRYTVATASGEFDTDGIAVSTTLDLNSGAIADLATNALSPLTFTAPTLTSVLVAQTPAAPTITSITPSSGMLSVAFTAGATNGSSITNYEYSTNNGLNWTTRSPVATTSPISISGLSNGTAYNVRIRAVNAAGSGESSTAVSATPSAVVITGDATLTTTYGQAASTGTYTSSGGTSPYTYTLSATPSGVSISGGVVTASASTAAGTYTQNVVSTDSASQTGLKQLTITVNKASTTISISLPNSATDAPLGGAITITATVSQAGSVNFKLGGSSISGCSAVASSAGTATCSWTPGALGGASLTAVLTPTDSTNYEAATTTTLSITVVNGVTTVSLALAGGVTQTPKGQNVVITATVDQAGRISFFADGKRIPGCFNKAVSGSTRTCTWKPTIQKQVNLTSRLVPTNNAYSTATGSLNVTVVRRTGTR